MAATLRSARSKFERANSHVEVLREGLVAWFEENPFRLAMTASDDRTAFSLGVSHDGSVTPDDWGLLLGEIMHNYRSALDHAVYQLAEATSRTSPPPNDRALAFPISGTLAEFNRDAPRRLGPTWHEPAIRAAVELAQPHACPAPDTEPHALLLLQDLNNADKHRLVPVLAAMIGSLDEFSLDLTDAPITMEAGETLSVELHRWPVEDGTAIVTWRTERPWVPEDQSRIRITGHRPTIAPAVGVSIPPQNFVGCGWAMDHIRTAVDGVLLSLERAT